MTEWDVIRWWEIRRLAYNALLFLIGILSVIGMELLMSRVIPVGEDAVEPLALAFGIVVYGILANLCYTLGWIVELFRRRKDPVRAREQGSKLFVAGLWFSCLLTSIPIWFGIVFRLTHRNP